MPAVIEVSNLHFHYDDGTPALSGVDFRLEAGETVALLGANGSGKTTFVMHLNGLLRGQGVVRVCGLTVDKSSLPTVRDKVGMVFQDSESQLFMPTVLADVAFGLLNRGMATTEALERARAALKTVGMTAAESKAPYHLSAGEKKRVAIAGILVMEPEILVLDEPTTFLDPPGQRALLELLTHLHQAKILVTHDTRFAQALCKRAVFFHEGRVAADGPVEDMIVRFGWDFALEGSNSNR